MATAQQEKPYLVDLAKRIATGEQLSRSDFLVALGSGLLAVGGSVVAASCAGAMFGSNPPESTIPNAGVGAPPPDVATGQAALKQTLEGQKTPSATNSPS